MSQSGGKTSSNDHVTQVGGWHFELKSIVSINSGREFAEFGTVRPRGSSPGRLLLSQTARTGRNSTHSIVSPAKVRICASRRMSASLRALAPQLGHRKESFAPRLLVSKACRVRKLGVVPAQERGQPAGTCTSRS